MSKPRTREIARLAYSIPEAAEALGMGETFFRAEVLPKLDRVDAGSRVLVDVEDVKAWLKQHKVSRLDLNAGVNTTRSVSGSTESDTNQLRAQAIERKLIAKRVAYTRRQSIKAQSPHLAAVPASSSPRKPSRNG